MTFRDDWVRFSAAIFEPLPRSKGFTRLTLMTDVIDLSGLPIKYLTKSFAKLRLRLPPLLKIFDMPLVKSELLR